MIPASVMLWLAMRLGKRVDWTGPTVIGHGYAWCGKIWFPPQDNRQRWR